MGYQDLLVRLVSQVRWEQPVLLELRDHKVQLACQVPLVLLVPLVPKDLSVFREQSGRRVCREVWDHLVQLVCLEVRVPLVLLVLLVLPDPLAYLVVLVQQVLVGHPVLLGRLAQQELQERRVLLEYLDLWGQLE